MTIEEHLRADIGSILSQMVFQIAYLKAERDTAREESARAAGTNSHAPQEPMAR